jgi:hypothetical protein
MFILCLSFGSNNKRSCCWKDDTWSLTLETGEYACWRKFGKDGLRYPCNWQRWSRCVGMFLWTSSDRSYNFCVVIQRRFPSVLDQRFGTVYSCHLQGPVRICSPETLVKNRRKATLGNISKVISSYCNPGASLKLRIPVTEFCLVKYIGNMRNEAPHCSSSASKQGIFFSWCLNVYFTNLGGCRHGLDILVQKILMYKITVLRCRRKLCTI